MLKHILALAVIAFASQNLMAQSVNDRAKAYYIQAELDYDEGHYTDAINNLNKVEEILGSTNARVVGLKVKAYYAKGDYENAQKSLDLFSQYSSKASEDLVKEVFAYIPKVEAKLKEAEERRIALERKRQDEERLRLAKQREEEVKREKDAIDKANWLKAFSINTIESYNNYLSSSSNIAYRKQALGYIDEINWEAVFAEKDVVEAAKKFIVEFPKSAFFKYAQYVVEYSDVKYLSFSYDDSGSYYVRNKEYSGTSIGSIHRKYEVSEVIKIIELLVNLKELEIRVDNKNPHNLDFSKLKNLEKIDIKYSDNSLEFIGLGKLAKLRYLQIAGLETKKAYNDFFSLNSLQEVSAPFNQEQLNQLTQNCPYVKALEMTSISNISDFCGLSKLLLLKELSIRTSFENRMEVFPVCIYDLSSLEVLIMPKNYFEELPEGIGNLKQLKKLDLSDNWGLILPADIGDLKNLEELNLSYDHIEILPQSFLQLTNLKTLDIYFGIESKEAKKMVKSLEKSNPYMQVIIKYKDHYDYNWD